MERSAKVDTNMVMNSTGHMRDAVFFEGPEVLHRLSRFWILITLASVIAAAGVAADSTATVIGAMIVAPLMTPILGTMLSVVLADRSNLIRSLLLIEHVWARDLKRAIRDAGGFPLGEGFLTPEALAEVATELVAMSDAIEELETEEASAGS